MNYKAESDQLILNGGIAYGHFDEFTLTFLSQSSAPTRDIRTACYFFEEVMAYSGEETEEYIKDLRDVLLELEYFSRHLQIRELIRHFREMDILRRLADFIFLKEPNQSDQSILQIGLLILRNSAERSTLLCSLALQFGVAKVMELSWKYYNEHSRGIVLFFFQTIFSQKPNQGEIAFVPFIFQLCQKYITSDYFDRPDKSINLGEILSQVLYLIGEYPLISDDDAKEAEIRQYFLDAAMFILNNRIVNCFCSAIKGLFDLISHSNGLILLQNDLLGLAINLLENEPNTNRLFFLIQLLTNIYKYLPPELAETSRNITEQNIQMFLNFVMNYDDVEIIQQALLLYQNILPKFPMFLPALFSPELVENLEERCAIQGVFQLKNSICQYLALIMMNGPSEAIQLILNTSLIDDFFTIVYSDNSNEILDQYLEGIYASIQKCPEEFKEYMIRTEQLDDLDNLNTESELKSKILEEFQVDE